MTATLSAIDRARAYIAKIPGAIQGSGGDCQTLAVANALVWDFALGLNDALTILREYNVRCSPPWSETELVRKLQSAEKQPHTKPRGNLLAGNGETFFRPAMTAPAPVKIDPINAIENYLKGFRCTPADLIAASTCKISPLICERHFHRQGAYLIDQLFEPGERVNIVTNAIVSEGKARPGDTGLTLERNEWESRLLESPPSHPGGVWLRMNPLDGEGVADSNITAFRFALIECDAIPMDLQVPLLAKLRIPTAAIISSGGRSLHSWVKVDCATAEDYRQTVSDMLALLARFGVDTKNKNPSRLSRLPGVIRSVGASGDGKQRLLYLNPEPKQEAIL